MKLKQLRVVLALIVFSLLTFFMIDFSGSIPEKYMFLTRVQLVPALLAGSLVILAGLFILTLLVGRLYCSVLCPLGIYQDIITWLRKRFKPRMRQRYTREKKWLRLTVLAAVIIGYFGGWTMLLSLLDPYSGYSRMAAHLFKPVWQEGNNLLAAGLNRMDNYSLYKVPVLLFDVTSFLIALLTIGVVSLLAILYGRSWCNTVCPVGTVLGYVSKFSLFKMHIDPVACNECGLCELTCKSSCLDSSRQYIDASRCVVCFNCLESCRHNALHFQPVFKSIERKDSSSAGNEVSNPSRRRFLGTLTVTSLTVPATVMGQHPLNSLLPKPVYEKKYPVSPPGALSYEHLLAHCTACHLCISRCPTKVLKPALLEYGIGGMMQPRLDYTHGFCNYDCTLCTEVCPSGALRPLSVEAKHRTQMGRVVFVKELCVVYNDETSCGACSEHCPTQAVTMVPYKGNLTIPSIQPDICIGCLGCEYVCPVRPLRAIYVEGNPVQLEAKPFHDAPKETVNIGSFGF